MKSVWLDANRIRGVDDLFPQKCVVCGKRCDERIYIRAVSSNPIVGGLGYLLGATRKFLVPAHIGKSCANKVKKKLFQREVLPMLILLFASLLSLLGAIVVSRAYIFFIFLALILVGLLEFFLDRRKDWWVRINESPADGLVGAYEFEFRNEDYAEEFSARNISVQTD